MSWTDMLPRDHDPEEGEPAPPAVWPGDGIELDELDRRCRRRSPRAVPEIRDQAADLERHLLT